MDEYRNSDQFKHVLRRYWDYYLELENEILETRKYVEFEVNNFSTYSLEYLKLLNAVCGEIDTIAKALAQLSDPSLNSKQLRITNWLPIVYANHRFHRVLWSEGKRDEGVSLTDASLEFCEEAEIGPWLECKEELEKPSEHSVSPIWWKDYTAVKHKRFALSQMATSITSTKQILATWHLRQRVCTR